MIDIVLSVLWIGLMGLLMVLGATYMITDIASTIRKRRRK